MDLDDNRGACEACIVCYEERMGSTLHVKCKASACAYFICVECFVRGLKVEGESANVSCAYCHAGARIGWTHVFDMFRRTGKHVIKLLPDKLLVRDGECVYLANIGSTQRGAGSEIVSRRVERNREEEEYLAAVILSIGGFIA